MWLQNKYKDGVSTTIGDINFYCFRLFHEPTKICDDLLCMNVLLQLNHRE